MPSNAEILHYSGETLDFECQPGYKVVGNATVECHQGNWTEVDFSCESKSEHNLSNVLLPCSWLMAGKSW